MSHVVYATTIDSLMYKMVCTRHALHMQWEYQAGDEL